MADPVATAFVEIRPDVKKLVAELKALETTLPPIRIPVVATSAAVAATTTLGRATKQTTKELTEQSAVVAASTGQMNRFTRGVAATGLAMFGLRGATLAATSAFLAGAAGITLIAKSLAAATSFNSQLAVFAAVTGATAAQMARVSDAAQALGRDLTLPGVSAQDAAVAMTELAKAGLSVEDAIAGARGVLQLAGAAGIDFAQATELAASAINAFGLSGRDAIMVADTLANAANEAQGSIVDVGIAFQQAAAVGHLVGLSFRDTTVFITALARAGLTGSDAGTSLRTALIRLLNPTKQAAAIFQQLHIAVRDATGNLRPDFFVNLGLALEGMSKKQKDATLAIIGGQDAVRALAILSQQSVNDLIHERDALAQSGTAAKVNEARMTGLAGAGANLKNTIEAIALSLGQRATPSMISFTNSLTATVQAVAASPLVTGTLADSLHAVGEGFRLLGAAVEGIAPVIGGVATGLNSVVQAIGAQTILAGIAAYAILGRTLLPLIWTTQNVAAGLRAMVIAMGEAGGVTAALRIGTASVGAGLLSMATSVGFVTVALAALTAGIVFFATRESDVERATKRLSGALDDLHTAMVNADNAATDYAGALSSIKTDKLAVTTARLAVEAAKHAAVQARATGDAFRYAQAQHGVAVAEDDLRLALRQLAADQKKATAAQEVDANAQREFRRELIESGNALDKVNAKIKEEIAQRQFLAKATLPPSQLGGELQKLQFQGELDLVRAIKTRAAEERKAGDESSLNIAKRLDALAELAHAMHGLQAPVIDLIFNAKDVTQGLKQVQAYFTSTGQKSAANFTAALRAWLDPSTLLDPVKEALDAIMGIAADAGAKSGESFGKAFIGSVKQWLGVAAGFSRQALEIQTGLTPGGDEARLAALQKQKAAVLKAIANLKDVNKHLDTYEKLLNQLQGVESEIETVEGNIASKKKAAEDARAKKQQDAQRARDEADRRFQDALGIAQTGVQIRQARAQLTAGLRDDIAAELAYQRMIERWILKAARTIHDLTLRKQVIQALRLAQLQSRKAVQQMEADQKAAAAEAAQRIVDRRRESLELDVETAQASKNRQGEIRAHQALLRFLIDRRNHTSRGSVEWKRLTLAIIQEEQAIAELKKQTDNRNKALDEFRKSEFEFLQRQTGFVSGVLSNILPVGVVAGTVGGGAISTPTTTPNRDVGRTAATQAQQSQRPGPSEGQMGTLIAIQRLQLVAMQRLVNTRTHPEARAAQGIHAPSMDVLGW